MAKTNVFFLTHYTYHLRLILMNFYIYNVSQQDNHHSAHLHNEEL